MSKFDAPWNNFIDETKKQLFNRKTLKGKKLIISIIVLILIFIATMSIEILMIV
ncbi:MAG: hypothetical protein AABX34_04170 [Nanoarchaeota archaeon]